MNDSPSDKYDYVQEAHELDLLTGDLASAFIYWKSLCDGDQLPTWHQFDLLQLPIRLIPLTHIYDAVNNGSDFRCRFWGTGIADIVGEEMSNRLITSWNPSHEFTATVIEQMSGVVTSRLPRTTTSYLQSVSGRELYQILLRVPLNNDAGETVHCVTFTDFPHGHFQSHKEFQNIR